MIVREAASADAARMVELMAELGFAVDEGGVRDRLAHLSGAGEPVLVAEDAGEVIALVDWHVMSTIHRETPVGRIAALVVARAHRSRGVGRALVEEAERRMRKRGCAIMEVTSNRRLSDAHAFYEALGLERTSYRFAREL